MRILVTLLAAVASTLLSSGIALQTDPEKTSIAAIRQTEVGHFVHTPSADNGNRLLRLRKTNYDEDEERKEKFWIKPDCCRI
ncbi:secreted RxLR effector peptide protein, putative [Phytophthora infestans T30-4]|uniref:RxLR effector protein n=1 Tax=Phytophthora infestans (strain T30-4) TaxID=403677 RepID=D0N8E6_PHYIT|nr:secreted RxLR effector peptide protein, putative [Phytophthora infestans T30-4]EEY53831.1 secreted RxLR effector peptide protein, putative [Phytophthora infestans T30-4]|eukprot:XP_002904462.1 secreted RxLR effector peptide protein, putative [Phytophthora infestans T30-4]